MITIVETGLCKSKFTLTNSSADEPTGIPVPKLNEDADEGDSEPDSSEEDSDDDEEEARKVREGFIVEDEDPERAERRKRKKNRKKRKHRDRDANGTDANGSDERRHVRRESDQELDEDDFDLLMESGERGLKRLKRAQEKDLTNMFDEDEELEDEVEVEETRPIGRGGEFDDFIEDDLSEDEIDKAQREQQERMRNRSSGRQELTADSVGMDADAFQDVIDVFGDGNDYLDALQSDEEESDREQKDGPDLKKLFEPSDLKSRMLTDEDEIIRMTDEPERMQIARGSYRDMQLDEEDFEWLCSWMQKQLWPIFLKEKNADEKERYKENTKLEELHKKAVVDVMGFYTRESLEVPYIWNHRREYLQCKDERQADIADNQRVAIQLINDNQLWRIMTLEVKFRSILEKRDSVRRLYKALDITDELFERQIQNDELNEMQDLMDLHDYLYFVYSENIRDMNATQPQSSYKRPTTKASSYEKARKSDIYAIVRLFGITANQFAENFAENNKRHYADDPEEFPEDIAENFVSSTYLNAEAVLKAARTVFVEELTHNPVVRRTIRATYQQLSEFYVRPTRKGISIIDEYHPYYQFKYADELSVEQLRHAPEMFLRILKGQQEGLLTLGLRLRQEESITSGIEALIVSDNFSDRSEQWNNERKKVVASMMDSMKEAMYGYVVESLRAISEDDIAQKCRISFLRKLNQRRPRAKNLQDHETPRVLAISNGLGSIEDATVAVFVDEKGRMREHRKFKDLRADESKQALREMLTSLKVDLIGIAGFSPQTIRLRSDVEAAIADLPTAEQPVVIYVNDEVARLYQNSPRAKKEYPSLGGLYRYCIALGHYLQSPVHEYVALGEELKQISWHPDQSYLPQDKLWAALESAIVDIVNLIGISINKAQDSVYEENLLQYVSGLGPRKASYLMRRIAQSGGTLDSRTELLEKRFITRNIFVNCASAIRIRFSLSKFNAQNRREEGASGIDILDETRIHPEDYDLANKMAADAQDLDEEDTAAIEGGPVLLMREKDAYDRLEDLILEDYADELFKAFNQPKLLTLQMIARELSEPYSELRRAFLHLTEEEIFTMLAGESSDAVNTGQIISAKIMKISSNYLNCRTESGIDVEISAGDMGIPGGALPEHHFAVNDAVRGLVTQLDKSSFKINLTLDQQRITDALRDQKRAIIASRGSLKWADFDEEKDQANAAAAREAETRSNRVIKHPLFRQFNARQAEEYLGGLARGDSVIRPSSKGPDHIAVTWKVADGVFQHLDVLELDKDSTHSIGTKLKVANAVYGDLDELLVSHVRAMSKKVDELQTHDKFQRGSRGDTEQYLTKYSEANPRRSCYAFCMDRKHPGYFSLLFKASPRASIGEWPVKVVPNAYSMRDNVYADMTQLCNGFKMLFAGQR